MLCRTRQSTYSALASLGDRAASFRLSAGTAAAEARAMRKEIVRARSFMLKDLCLDATCGRMFLYGKEKIGSFCVLAG